MKSSYKLHFISRAFPPVIGGIENQNHSIYTHLKKHFNLSYSINKKGKKALPLFLPLAFIKLVFQKNTTSILLGDGVLTILSWFSKVFFKKNRVICIVHGLDITYSNKIYQRFWISKFFKSVDTFIAVSTNTKNILISKGIDKEKIHVIPNGFDFDLVKFKKDINSLNRIVNHNISNKFRLLTLGRLVKRKGVVWFIQNIVKKLDDSFIYIIAGDGPEKDKILNTIKAENLSEKVFFCGEVTEYKKEIIFSNSHLFVQPNIPVVNDIEGFGISVIEASAYKLPVIAADLEGLKEAIVNNKNGWLVTPCNQIEYIHTIENYMNLPDKKKNTLASDFRNFSKKKYDWAIIIKRYLKVIDDQN